MRRVLNWDTAGLLQTHPGALWAARLGQAALSTPKQEPLGASPPTLELGQVQDGVEAHLEDLPDHGAGRRPPGPRQEHLREEEHGWRLCVSSTSPCPVCGHSRHQPTPRAQSMMRTAEGLRTGRGMLLGRNPAEETAPTLPSLLGRSAGSSQAQL